MIAIKEVKQRVNDGFYDKIKEQCVTYKKSKNEFIIEGEEYDCIFSLIYTKWSSYISLSAFAFLRHKKVENILHNITGENEYKITLGSEIKKISDSPDGRIDTHKTLDIHIEYEQDIESVIILLVQIFFDIALPFYKKYSNLLVIDSLFNDPPYNEMPVLVQRTGGDRCMKGLIMAKLVERENYFELVKSFDDFIDNNRNFLFQYNTVKKYLTNHNIG